MLRNLLLLTCLCGAMTVSVDAAVIRLREKATVDAALISLGDIANLSEVDEAEREQLQRLTLAPAPSAGRTTTITLDTIRRELSLRGIDQTNLQFSGPSQTDVSRYSRTETAQPQITVSERDHELLEQRLEQTVQQAIAEQLPGNTSIRVAFVESQIRDLLTTGLQSSRWQVDVSTIQRLGPQLLRFETVDSQGLPVARELRVVLSESPRVLALKRALPRGKVIRADDLQWVEAEQTAGLFLDPQEVIGTETIRSVRADQPLQQSDVRQLPLVRRNEIVSVSANIGSISVRRYCRSLGEASLGQFVTLVPVDGKDKITARVTGLREAEVLIDGQDLPGASAQPADQQGLILNSKVNNVRPAANREEGNIIRPRIPARQQLGEPQQKQVSPLANQPTFIQPAAHAAVENDRPVQAIPPQADAQPERVEPAIPWGQPGRILPNQPAALTE